MMQNTKQYIPLNIVYNITTSVILFHFQCLKTKLSSLGAIWSLMPCTFWLCANFK